jgi:hypothetical protein
MTPLDPFAAALASWQNFYMLTGAAAATLTGLMFVAVTFGSSLVTKETTATARAFLDPTVMHFVQVLFTGCVLVVPVLRATMLGGILIALGGLRLLGLSWVFSRYREAHRTHGDIESSDWMSAIVLPFLCHLSLGIAGVAFLEQWSAALPCLAAVTLALLILGIYSAWETLVWMAIAVRTRTDASPGAPLPAGSGVERR